MTIDEAIKVLELHNQWRKGAKIPMQTSVEYEMSIDLMVCELKELRKKSIDAGVDELKKRLTMTEYLLAAANIYVGMYLEISDEDKESRGINEELHTKILHHLLK